MPKTKNVSRAQWDHATRSAAGTASNSNSNHNTTENNTSLAAAATTLATALSPPTRVRPHATRTTSTMSATATRGGHRRAKENAENTTGGEKENTGRLRHSTRTHVTPGLGVSVGINVLGTTTVSTAKSSKPTPKPTVKPTKLRVKKQPLQDVTAQFACGGPGAGEAANRAGTAFAALGEEEVRAMRAEPANAVGLEAPERVATPARNQDRGRRGAGEPTSPLPPSSPPSDYRLPSSLHLDFALPSAVPLRAASPSNSIPVLEYDGWASFDSARPIGSPTRPVTVPALEEDAEEDKGDPFGFAALEKKLKAGRMHKTNALGPEDEKADEVEEDEDLHNIPIADTSSPRPESMLLRRDRSFSHHNNLKRALEEEMDEEEAFANSLRGSSPVGASQRLVLSSPVRAVIAAAAPLSTPAGEASPEHLHAHFATPPSPEHKTKRRRISGVPHVDEGVADDVFGPVQTCSSSSPGRVEAESPSPSKSTRKARMEVQEGEIPAADGDALDAFNAVLDAQEGGPEADNEPAGDAAEAGRTLRPRASRAALADEADDVTAAKEKKARSASRGRGRGTSRGRGRGRGTSRGRGASRSKSKSTRRTRAEVADHKDGDADVASGEDVDPDEKFEQERQARIAYFRGLDDYEVETEDVVFI